LKGKSNYDVFIVAEMQNYSKAVNVVQPLVVVAHEGYAFTMDFVDRVKNLNKLGNRTDDLSNEYGCSGYDNTLQSMQSFIIAIGPSFRSRQPQGSKSDTVSFANSTANVVDIYTLLCNILDINLPDGIDGKLDNVKGLLRQNNSTETTIEMVEDLFHIALSPEYILITSKYT